MRRAMLGCFVALTALQALAAGFGLKPGLWETRIVKQTRDGKDMTAQINGAMGQVQDRLANVSPEQREKIEAWMKEHGSNNPATGNGTIQTCITADMAREDKPPVSRDGCQPTTVKHSGNRSSFEFSCTRNGNTTSGKGESTVTGDVISIAMDMTMQRASGDSHVTHTETEMKFVSADCGDVKPITIPSAAPGTAPPHASP